MEATQRQRTDGALRLDGRDAVQTSVAAGRQRHGLAQPAAELVRARERLPAVRIAHPS